MNGHPSTEDEDQVLSGYFERLLIGGYADLVSASVATPSPVSGGGKGAGGSSTHPIELPDGCPAWIEGMFQVQVFRLGKLRFAAPMEQLVGAFALEGEIVVRPGQPGWASGQVGVAGREVWAVRLAELILPGKAIVEPHEWLLLPRSEGVALLCQGVDGIEQWRPEEVRWRSERISRPWLFGMHGDPPCPLIDVERLVQDLEP